MIGAIDSATDNPSRTHKFLDSVHGAMFFGVPNQGMQTGAFHSVVKDRPNKSLVTNLEKDSDYLTKQSKHFNKAIENHCLDMLYFYEEKLSPQLAFVSIQPSLLPHPETRIRRDDSQTFRVLA